VSSTQPALVERIVGACAGVGVESEPIEPRLKFQTDRRLDVHDTRKRMWDDEASRMELKFQGARPNDRRGCVVFRVAKDRMTQRETVGAELMGAAGDRAQREPGCSIPGAGYNDIVGYRGKPRGVAPLERDHFFAVINTDPVGKDAHAPTQWLAADLAAASARGAKKMFVFGHKPAYTYAYLANTATPAAGLEASPGNTADRDAFWNVIEANKATYFCGHEHIYNISQPKGGAYQVLVGAGGSPFEAKSTDVTKNPATDRDYSWATVRVHQDGGVDILGYGFDASFGPTQLLQQIYLP